MAARYNKTELNPYKLHSNTIRNEWNRSNTKRNARHNRPIIRLCIYYLHAKFAIVRIQAKWSNDFRLNCRVTAMRNHMESREA